MTRGDRRSTGSGTHAGSVLIGEREVDGVSPARELIDEGLDRSAAPGAEIDDFHTARVIERAAQQRYDRPVKCESRLHQAQVVGREVANRVPKPLEVFELEQLN